MSNPADSVTLGEKHRLLSTARICFGLLLAYIVWRGWHLPGGLLFLALLCTALAAWPALHWLRFQPHPFPAFEAFMLTCIPSYALQLVSEHEGVLAYDQRIVMRALLAVILFQACALAAYQHRLAHESRSPFWNDPLFTGDISRWLPHGLWLNAAYVLVSLFTDWLPHDIDSILRAIFFGLATACTFLLGRAWAGGALAPGQKANVILALLVTAAFQITSLYLISTITFALIFFLAYVSAGRRIPVVALLLTFAVLTVLHNGKGPMRVKYWEVGAPRLELADLPGFLVEWVNHGLQPYRDPESAVKKRELLERASLLHMICLVVDATDNRVPYMAGETYGYVLPMLVPRFFWPDKPSGQRTTSRLAIHFGLQDESSAQTTSIGFGVLAEAYANYGWWGVALLGLLIGWANKVITVWTRRAPLISNGGFFMILLMAWSVQVEMPMSSWVSSLYQAAICVVGVPYAIRRFLS